MLKNLTSYEQLPLTLNADQIGEVLGISRSLSYELLRSSEFSTVRIGKRMLVPKDKFIEWLTKQTIH